MNNAHRLTHMSADHKYSVDPYLTSKTRKTECSTLSTTARFRHTKSADRWHWCIYFDDQPNFDHKPPVHIPPTPHYLRFAWLPVREYGY